MTRGRCHTSSTVERALSDRSAYPADAERLARSDSARTRRDLLAALSVSAVGALAGCSDVLGEGSTPTPRSYPVLDGRTVYVDPALELSPPATVETVDSPGEADVVVVPADTDRGPSAIVHWLARGRYVVLLGGDAQATWHDVRDSGAYEAMLGEREARASTCSAGESDVGGSAGATPDCEPPDMILAREATEIPATTVGTTWGGTDDPTARQVFEAIAEGIEGEE